MASLLNGLNICADLIGMPVVLLLECAGACCGEFFRGNARIRRPPSFMVAALVLCAFLLITTLFAGANTSTAYASSSMPPPPPVHDDAPPDKTGAASTRAITERIAVTIRSQHTGRYWRVLDDESSRGSRSSTSTPSRLRIAASAPPEQRGHESTVFLLEREGEQDSGGWVLLRWLKTRQLIEAVPPGVPGREDDAWSVRLSSSPAVHELHKLIVEDDKKHGQSHIYSMGLRGYLNHLETSGEVVGHGDHLPPQLATEPPTRGAVSVEKLQTGAAWLMEALTQRDKQLDGLQQQLTAMRAELAAAIADRPTPGRPVSSREPIRPQQGEGDDGEGDGGVQSKLRASSKKDGGALAELRSAPQKKARVHVECPTAAAVAASRKKGREEDDEEEEEEEEEEAPRRRPTRRAASAAKQRTADMMDTS